MQTNPVSTRDILGIVLALLLLGALLYSSFLVMLPFIPALIWASMIVVSTWNIMLAIQKRMGGSRRLAVLVMALMLTLIMIVPLTIAFVAVIENIDSVGDYIRNLASHGLPPAPKTIESLPIVGPKLVSRWDQISNYSREELVTRISPYIGTSVQWTIRQFGSVGSLLVHLILTLILSVFLYANGEKGSRGLMAFFNRIAPLRGEQALSLAGQAVRAVANGVVVTALIQAAATTIGLLLAGVPYAVILGSVAFFLSVIQIGTGPVLIGATIWLFYGDSTLTAWIFLGWTAIIMLSDNFIRPVLIKRGANLPLVLVLSGVIGGLISFGIIGIFVGPVVLAVTYTLLQAWTKDTGGAVPPPS